VSTRLAICPIALLVTAALTRSAAAQVDTASIQGAISDRYLAPDSLSSPGIVSLRFEPILCAVLTLSAFIIAKPLWAWGGPQHSDIVGAALTSIPADDHLGYRLGNEAWHLRNTVQMGDWVNSLVTVNEIWKVTPEEYPLINSEYFGNDYLISPMSPHTFDHSVPGVTGTYRPFFLRSLQALRTEDPTNAVRWMGALLHFVTDSGSPPHALGLRGETHVKMETWLDASKIDLHGYQPALLGRTDEEAVAGLQKRMSQLIARNAQIASRMIPFAEANDRAHVEPLALNCATETAKVAADVIHTLMVLSAHTSDQDSGSIVANVSATSLAEHRLLLAKLVLLGTNYSTLSETNFANASRYSGTFSFAHLPTGTYRAAVERPGSETLFTPEFRIHKGEHISFLWVLKTAEGNMAQNPDFLLHWTSETTPDYWHYDGASKCWLSDNIPVLAGHRYRAFFKQKIESQQDIHLQWMAEHWKASDDPMVPLSQKPIALVAPPTAVYVRFCIRSTEVPSAKLHQVYIGEMN